jgi:hypothetical protein
MALKMDCRPLFEISEWADVRASRGARGTFLFINNYQDDPVSLTVAYEGESLFGSNSVRRFTAKTAALYCGRMGDLA